MSSLIDQYSKEELIKIVETSFSYAEVLSRLGYSTAHGRNHQTLKNRIEHYDISIEHFCHKAIKKWTDEEIFCKNSKVSQRKLRDTFKEKEIVPYKCSVCELEPFWNGKPLVLTLDHINGENKDNRIENLRWICPNCDRQSNTYGAKNRKELKKGTILYTGNYSKTQEEAERALAEKKIKDEAKANMLIIKQSKPHHCIDCGKEISRGAYRCIDCINLAKRKTSRPTKDELYDLLKLHKGNFTLIGNMYNVSDNTIRKWCRKYFLPFHTSDYNVNANN